MIEVWHHNRVVQEYPDGYNFLQVKVEDRVHLVIFDERGEPYAWHLHDEHDGALIANYDPVTGARLPGPACIHIRDDPDCRTCHP